MKISIGLLILMLLIGAAGLAEAASSSPSTRRIAVVIGANAAPPGRKVLRYAHNDANNVAQSLRRAGFRPDDIHVLHDPDPKALIETLDGALGESAMLFFYYSGHADAASVFPNGKALPLTELRTRLSRSAAVVRVGIIDACRGGGWTGTKGLSETDLFAVSVPVDLSNEGSVLISSSSGLEDAHESEKLQGSFFTHHWNAALSGVADDNQDGVITLNEAFQYAKKFTIRDTALYTSDPQHPSFQMNLRGKTDLPLVTMTSATSVLAVEQDAGPLQLVHLGSGVVVLEIPEGKRSLRLSLPPGRYLVRRQAGADVYAKEIDVIAGKVTEVTEEKLLLVGNAKLAMKGDVPTERTYMGIGIGTGGISGSDMEESSLGMSLTLQLGRRLTPSLHLVFGGEYTAFTRYQLDPDFSQQQSALTFGLRWQPFDYPRQADTTTLDLTNFHVRAGLGVGHMIRQPYGSFNPLKTSQGKWGGAATLGIGWNFIRTDTIDVGIEATDSPVIYKDETRHNYGVNLLMQAALF